jgi:hypothetical protein
VDARRGWRAAACVTGDGHRGASGVWVGIQPPRPAGRSHARGCR